MGDVYSPPSSFLVTVVGKLRGANSARSASLTSLVCERNCAAKGVEATITGGRDGAFGGVAMLGEYAAMTDGADTAVGNCWRASAPLSLTAADEIEGATARTCGDAATGSGSTLIGIDMAV
jgi:hypothetical protein